MPIQIIDGFKLGTSRPIDDRIVGSGSSYRDNITYKYDGLLVVDTSDHKPYIWNSNSLTWSVVESNNNNNNNNNGSSITELTLNNKKYYYIGTNPTSVNNTVDLALNVTGGINVNGDIKVSGKFIGDGNSISNINPANISSSGASDGYVLQLVGSSLTPTWKSISSNKVISQGLDDTKNYFAGFVENDSGDVTSIRIKKGGVGIQNKVFYLNDGIGLSASSTLIVGGNSTLNGTTIGGTLTVAGITTLNGNLIVSSGKTTTLNGNTTITGTNTFTVSTGATKLGGTLTVAGITTLNGNLIVSSGKTTTLNGNTTIGGTLTVAGTTTLNGNLIVSTGKTTTLNGNTTITGANTFTVGTGATTLGGTLKIGSGTTIRRVVAGILSIARNGLHSIILGGEYIESGSGSTSGNVATFVVNFKIPMSNTNFIVLVGFSGSVNAYPFKVVAERIAITGFKVTVSHHPSTSSTADWSGTIEVSFLVISV